MSNKASLPGPDRREIADAFRRRGHDAWTDLALKYGKTFGFRGVTATCDPILVRTLLMTKKHTRKRSHLYQLLGKVPGTAGVLFMDGAAWQRHTKAIMSVFTPQHANQFPAYVHHHVNAYVAGWQDRDNIADLFTACAEMNVGIAARVFYGLDHRHTVVKPLLRELVHYKFMTMRAEDRNRIDTPDVTLSQLRHLPSRILHFLALQRQTRRLRDHVKTIIAADIFENDGSAICNMIRAGFTLDEITNEVNHIYGAFNAIDYVITCGLYEFGRHPVWADVLHDEFRTVLGGRDHPVREDIPKLPHCMKFVKEILRMYPVAMASARRTGIPVDTNGVTLPADSEVLILNYALHHHPDFWDRPKIFNPDRWNPQLEPETPFTHIPFLEGARQCIGRHLAELMMVVTLNAVLKAWQLEFPRLDIPVNAYLIPRFADDIACTVYRRG